MKLKALAPVINTPYLILSFTGDTPSMAYRTLDSLTQSELELEVQSVSNPGYLKQSLFAPADFDTFVAPLKIELGGEEKATQEDRKEETSGNEKTTSAKNPFEGSPFATMFSDEAIKQAMESMPSQESLNAAFEEFAKNPQIASQMQKTAESIMNSGAFKDALDQMFGAFSPASSASTDDDSEDDDEYELIDDDE